MALSQRPRGLLAMDGSLWKSRAARLATSVSPCYKTAMLMHCNLRLDVELVERLDRIAKATGVTRTDVVRRALEVGLPSDEQLVTDSHAPVMGAVLAALADFRVLEVVAKVMGEQVDPRQVEKFKTARENRAHVSPARTVCG